MSIATLLSELESRGVRLWYEGERLRFRAPRGALTPELRARLVAARPEVVAHMRSAAAERSEASPLSFAQRALWFLHQSAPESAAYNVAFTARIVSPLDEAALRQALQAIVDRHGALRTVYEVVDDRPIQRVRGAASAHLDVVDVAGTDAEQLHRRVVADYQRPFDLERGPVFRAVVYRRAPDDHVLLLVMHHIAVDGWSLLQIVEELAALYTEAVGDAAADLPRPEFHYTDFIESERQLLDGPEGKRLGDYWRQRLAEPNWLELPTDRARETARPTRQGATLHFEIAPDLAARARQVARDEGVTLFAVLLAAWKSLLFRYTGTEDVIVGTPTFGRMRPEMASVVGNFVNSIPLRSTLTAQLSFRALLQQVRQTVLEGIDAQAFPLGAMVERLGTPRDAARPPLFGTLFVLQRFDQLRALEPVLLPGAGGDAAFGALRLRHYPLDQQEGQFELTLQIVDSAGPLTASLKYDADLYDASTLERLAAHFTTLMAAALSDPSQSLGALPLLSADERAERIAAAGTLAPPRSARTLHARFEERAREAPDAIALISETATLTYGELNGRANRLAHCLRARGIGAETLVGLCVERTPDLIVGLLGILKAGGAYLPIDTAYPDDRVAFMLADAAAPVVVTQHTFANRFEATSATTVLVDDDLSSWPDTDPDAGAQADSLAYVIYTSGSTGQPKGTLMPHRAVLRLFDATDAWFQFGPSDVWTLFHSIAFDFSVWEIWGALLYGGSLVVVPYWVSRSPEALLALVERERVTVLNHTPSAFRQLIQADAASPGRRLALRTIIFGGEALEVQSLRPWFDRYGDIRPRLVNMYGITETCVHVTYRLITLRDVEARAGSMIGEPIPDLRVHVLDPRGEPVPIGVIGEMYVGGPGLARGYLNRPELTAARFVPDPFIPGERLYRTGDLARRHLSGDLEYVGRLDHQVKIRGFRIELGEIEAALARYPAVRDVAVIAREDSPGDRRLVAYVVASDDTTDLPAALRASLKTTLPEYMVPTAFVFLERLPLTANGKLDRRALPTPGVARSAATEYLAPRTPIEATIAEVWTKVLNVDRVGVHDNFFELGGDSILSMQVVSRARGQGLAITPRDMFERQTVAALAVAALPIDKMAYAANDAATEPVAPDTAWRDHASAALTRLGVALDGIEDVYPLTPAQHGMLFHSRLAPESRAYLLQLAATLPASLDPRAFEAAWKQLAERHAVLRTSFIWEELEQPLQVVSRRSTLSVQSLDWRSLSAEERQTRLLRFMEEDRASGFALQHAPLLRVTLIRMGDDEYRVVMAFHHLILDGWSLAVLLHELFAFHAANLRGERLSLEAARPFREYVDWRERQDAKATERFWRTALAGLRAPTPLGIERAPLGDDPGHASHELTVLPALANSIHAFASRHHVTLNSVMRSAWALLLRCTTGHRDVVFGATVAGRPAELERVESIVGMCINTIPVRVDVAPEAPFATLVETVQAQSVAAREFEHAALRDVHRWSDVPGGSPLFQSILVFENYPVDDALRDGGSLMITEGRGHTDYPMSVFITPAPRFSIVLSYDTRWFDAAAVARFGDQFRDVLARAVANPTDCVADIERSLAAAAPRMPDTEPANASIRQLLEALGARDIRLSLDGEKLKVNAPKGAVTDEWRTTIAAQRAAIVAALRAETAPTTLGAGIRRIPREQVLPLSSAQQRLWFLDRMEAGGGHARYNIGGAMRIRGPLDATRLAHAVDHLVDRHESLRTRIPDRDGVPVIEITEAARARLTHVDLTQLPPGEQHAAVQRLASERLATPFDLATGPLTAYELVRLADDEHVLMLAIHHIVADGWSLLIAMRELSRIYGDLATARASAPAPDAAPIDYVDYAAWEQSQLATGRLREHLNFWKQELAGAPAALELPTDRARPSKPSLRGSRLTAEFDPALLAPLHRLSRERGVTLFMTLVAAFQVLLQRYSQQEDVVIGSPMATRPVPELEGIIGCFVNNLVLRGRLAGNPTFGELLERTRRTVVDALAHGSVPFDLIVDAMRSERASASASIFQVMLTLHSFATEIAPPPGLTFDFLPAPDTGAARFDLVVEISEFESRFRVVYEYATELFDEDTVRRLHEQFARLLRALIEAPDAHIGELPLLDAADARVLLDDWNATSHEHNRARCVHHMLEASAAGTPDAIAVVAGESSLTYRQLDERANQVAHLLARRGVTPGSLVAVCVDRTLDMPIAIAAVLKSGAAYVPLDPTHPAERLRYTLEDAGVSCVITTSRFASLVADVNALTVSLDSVGAELSAMPTTPVSVSVAPADRAYVIYTSGSTGRPKGVEVEHRNIVAFLEAMRREPGFTPNDTLLAVTTLSFDIAGLEFWLPLSVGGKVVIASRAEVLDGERLIAMIERHAVTVMQATPATWRLLLDAGWSGNRKLKVLCGGEALPRDLSAELVPRVAELWNMYGPTETTIWSTVCHVNDAAAPITIGRPIANTRIYILEPSGQPAPIGVAGELCIGGEGVARGYHNRPELTAEKFVTITLPDGRAERVYRTGDLARYRADGRIDFLGRRDQQVKVRGYRIELGEIEAVLATHPGIAECVTAVREIAPGDHRIVAYVVLAEGTSLDADAARTTLRERLPEYMIPSIFTTLATLPLTPNGKIDRNALPAPHVVDQPAAPSVSELMMTPVQRRVAAVWRDVLRTDRVGLHDNFFDIGGHSLLLVRLHASLKREFAVGIELVELFQWTTVAAQANRLSVATAPNDALRRAQARAARQINE